jgi:hypothetical protein
MAKEKTFSIRQYVGYQRVADVLFGAGEGIRYWAGDSGYDLGCTDPVMQMLGGGAPIEVIDYEDDTVKDPEDGKHHKLTLAKIKKGLQILAKKYPDHYADIVGENDDMYTGDALVQCALFGNIIYS